MRPALALLLLVTAGRAPAAEPPLPDGAVRRFGTTAFRTSGGAVCLSPDGTRAAVRVADGIDVLNLDTGERAAALRDPRRLPDVIIGRDCFRLTFAFAAGGKEVVSAADADGVHVWDAGTGKFLRTIPGPPRDDFQNNRKVPAAVKAVFNGQLGAFVLVETHAGWHALDAKGARWTRIEGSYDKVADVSPDGRWVTDYTDAASIENHVGLTDTRRNRGVFATESRGDYPFLSTPSPDGTRVACAVAGPGLQLWDVATKKERELQDVPPKFEYGRPAFSPDGKVLLAAAPGSVYDEDTPPHFARWDAGTGKRLGDLAVPARISGWAIDHANNRLVVIAGQCVIRYDLATGRRTDPPGGFSGAARPALAPDGKRAAVGDAAGVLRLYDAPFTAKPKELRVGGAAVHDLQFSNDGRTLYAGLADRSAVVFDLATGRETPLPAPPPNPEARTFSRHLLLAASPDGRTVVAVVETDRLWAWDAATGKHLWSRIGSDDFRRRGPPGCRPAFAPDGSAVYVGQPGGEIATLDPRTGKELGRVAAPVRLRSDVTRLAVSPDGKALAAHTYRNDGELVLFEIGKGVALWRRTFTLNTAMGDLAFLADGSAVVSTHGDGTIRGWKATDGSEAFVRRGPAGWVARVQPSADGTRAVTDAPGATALLWELK